MIILARLTTLSDLNYDSSVKVGDAIYNYGIQVVFLMKKSRITKNRKLNRPIHISEEVAFKHYPLYKSEYQQITRMPSFLKIGAITILLIAVSRIYDVLTYCFSEYGFYIEPRDKKFLLYSGGSAILLFLLSLIVRNPRRQMKKKLDKFFENVV